MRQKSVQILERKAQKEDLRREIQDRVDFIQSLQMQKASDKQGKADQRREELLLAKEHERLQKERDRKEQQARMQEQLERKRQAETSKLREQEETQRARSQKVQDRLAEKEMLR